MPSPATTQNVVVNLGLARCVFGSKMDENTGIRTVCWLVLVDICVGKEIVDVIDQIKGQKWTWPDGALAILGRNEIAGFQRAGNRAVQLVSQWAFQRAIGCPNRLRSQNSVPAGLAMPTGQS